MNIYSFLASSNNGGGFVVVPFILFAAILVMLVRGVENQEQDRFDKKEQERKECIKRIIEGLRNQNNKKF